jgi:hypothetical protein
MNLEERIGLMKRLGDYIVSSNEVQLKEAKQNAFEKNQWFTPEFIDLALQNISDEFLNESKLREWVKHYCIDDTISPEKLGIVMAGNIPLVGFHDFLCAFIVGHHQIIKLSEKDEVLMKHIIAQLIEWNPEVIDYVSVADRLNNCTAYIATGSNNSSRYFDYYFGKYPSIIRKNKTSVAVLSGNETEQQLNSLVDDVNIYFGLGCRNVTKIWVPEGYDFVPLITAFKKYNYFGDHTKFRNNYDYNLALLIMNNKFYMTNDSVILVENENIFSPVSELHYSFYKNENELRNGLQTLDSIQCIVSEKDIPFGESQAPSLMNYPDGVDTMQFLLSL